jgi:hypothetical protein
LKALLAIGHKVMDAGCLFAQVFVDGAHAIGNVDVDVTVLTFINVSLFRPRREPLSRAGSAVRQGEKLYICISILVTPMQDIGAEYYVSNMHKWMFCPSGYVDCIATAGAVFGSFA